MNKKGDEKRRYMKQGNASKIKLVKILEILCRDSDEENYIDSTEILEKLASMGIECDRRTLYGDVKVLNNFGYEVLSEKSPGKPNRYCVVNRSFNVPELRILMDAVQASSFITPAKTEELVNKIADLGGRHRAELLRSNIVKFNTTKSKNENIFYSINEINAAIENDKKVSFEYFDFNAKHERVYRREGKRYFVNPLATIFDDDNYYFICYYGNHEGVVHFRVARMNHVQMLSDQPREAFSGEPVDIKRHKKTLFGMFQGEESLVEFQVDESILDPVFDVFGDKIKIVADENGKLRFKAEVQVSATFFGWCLSFGDKLRVTGPDEVVEKLIEYLSALTEKYNQTQKCSPER